MDAAEFKLLFLPCHPKLYRMAFRLVGNAQDAEDMVQETYYRLWSKREEFFELENPDGFCMATLKNVCFDSIRRKHLDEADELPESLTLMADDDVAPDIETHDEAVKVMDLINRLPEPQRRVMTLRDVADMSFDEIELSTGLSPGNIRTLLSRARKKIREQYNLLLNYERK